VVNPASTGKHALSFLDRHKLPPLNRTKFTHREAVSGDD
jgi:hypothetical protein